MIKFWNDGLSNLVLEMLGADDAAFVFISASGNIISQTAGARRLLHQNPLRPVGEVLGARAAQAVSFVLETGGESALTEEIDGHLYRLEIRAAFDGALLYFSLAEDFVPSLPSSLSGQIASSLSHILAIIHLIPGSDDTKQTLLLDDIKRSSLRIYRGLSHLRLLEYADDPERLLCFDETDVSALCRDLSEQCQAVCSARGIATKIEVIAPDHCLVTCDKTLMIRAVLNLLSNALGAPGATKVCLRVQHAQGRVTITVSDNGSGLPPQALARLYHGWARPADPSDIFEQQASGIPSGLGLPLVRKIAGWHGGALLLENSTNGTIFRLTFPDSLRPTDPRLSQPNFEETLDPAEIELAAL